MFSDIIKALRTERGLTQTQLAREIGVSPGNIGDWEIGRSKPGYTALAALSRFFGIPADELLELTPLSAEGGARQHGATDREPPGAPLTTAEAGLLAMFRLLPPVEQEDLFDLACFKYKKHVEKKTDSIYRTYAAEQKSGAVSGEPVDETA